MEEFIKTYSGDAVYSYLRDNAFIQAEKTLIVATGNVINLKSSPPVKYDTVINLKRINNIKDIDLFFREVNTILNPGGLFIGCVETTPQRKKRLFKKYPFALNGLYYFADYIFKRVFPKLKMTRWFYMWLTNDRNRVMSMPETIGRLSYAGFREYQLQEIDGYLYFFYWRILPPITDGKPSYGLFIKMPRIGFNGKEINIYKVRTMVPYSEFIQDYVYNKNDLKKGGKFKDDFRITRFGGFLRKYWLDELPMFWNLLKGEVKWVGVRPLSRHYLSLYDEDLRVARLKVKPGLFPPYYADLPDTLEEIMDSERKYLKLYAEKPLRTNISYFFRIFKNIFIKGVRSS